MLGSAKDGANRWTTDAMIRMAEDFLRRLDGRATGYLVSRVVVKVVEHWLTSAIEEAQRETTHRLQRRR